MGEVRRAVGVIVALHGFLGRPEDWDFLREHFDDVVAPDLLRGDAIPAGDVLLGYSMGGRLALQALQSPDRAPHYRKVVLVSTGLGIEDEQQRAARRAADDVWARRFEREEWGTLMRDWNAQPVFGGREHPRREEHFDRNALARALRDWSPGLLPAAAPRLHELTFPTLVIAGARDDKYVAEAHRAASLLRNAEVWIADGAGHRVPWEAPDAFIARLRTFVE